jgi:cytochrome c-type biogenesis protein CcmE
MTEVALGRRRRAGYLVAAALCGAVVVWMLVLLGRNVVYLVPVSEAVAERGSGDARLRMGGAVVPGSVRETGGGVRFQVTEGGQVANVDHDGDPPDLFRDCQAVVVEGSWDGETFRSDRLLVRHGSEYVPPDGAAGPRCPDSTGAARR